MRDLKKNFRKVYYSNLISTDEIIDDGITSLEFRKTYSPPKLWNVNIGNQRGIAEAKEYGIQIDYEISIITSDTNCPVTELAVVWFGSPTSSSPDYEVVARITTKNSIFFGLKKVHQ